MVCLLSNDGIKLRILGMWQLEFNQRKWTCWSKH